MRVASRELRNDTAGVRLGQVQADPALDDELRALPGGLDELGPIE